jgi:hypothetical protein
MVHTGAITMTASAPNESPSASLKGTGVVPVLTMDMPSYSFPGTGLKMFSTATFTVTNSGAGDAGILSVKVTQPANLPGFSVPPANDTCSGHALTAGNKCSFELQFAPGNAGEYGSNRNGALSGTGPFVTITDGTYSATVNILSAPGIVQGQPFLVLEPNPLDFDNYASKTQTISVGNYGTVAASGIGGIGFSGGTSAYFTMPVGGANPCLSPNVGLAAFTSAPAPNCTWQARFTPPATAPPQLVSATYLIRTNTGNGTNEPTGTLSGTP